MLNHFLYFEARLDVATFSLCWSKFRSVTSQAQAIQKLTAEPYLGVSGAILNGLIKLLLLDT